MAASSSSYGQLVDLGAAAAAAPAYIGALMNLITHSEIRYQGLCIHLDFLNGTVALTDIKNFGSEGRRADVQIPPTVMDYDTVLFRGTEIKEIQVLPLPNNPSIATLPDHPFVVESDPTHPSFTSPQVANVQSDQTHPSSTSPQVANVTSEIAARLSAIFQGIPSTTQSLWSSGYWASFSASLKASRDSFGMPTFSPGLARPSPSVGIISRPKRPSLPQQSEGLAVSRAPVTTTAEAYRITKDSIHFSATISKCSTVTSYVPLISVAPINCPVVQQGMSASAVPFYCSARKQNILNSNLSPIMPYEAQTTSLSCSSQILPNSSTNDLNLNVVLPPVVEEEQSTNGLTSSEQDLSIAQASESVPEDWESAHDLQQQSEKDVECDSLYGDTKVSEQPPEDSKKFSAHQRNQNGRCSQGSHRRLGARGSYCRGSTGNTARGRGRMVWVPVP